MNITTKYELKQPLWKIAKYSIADKTCEHCGQSYDIFRYKVLGRTFIDKIHFFWTDLNQSGILIVYEHAYIYGESTSNVLEWEIDIDGGYWYTTPEAAQKECQRKNASLRKE